MLRSHSPVLRPPDTETDDSIEEEDDENCHPLMDNRTDHHCDEIDSYRIDHIVS